MNRSELLEMATEFRVVDPKGYYKYFLDKKLRPDGRDLCKVRETCLNVGTIGTADGSALIKLGDTSVVCGIKAELVAPSPDRPRAGFVVPNIELPPLCSSRFKPGPPNEQAQVVTKLLDDVIRNSGCLDLGDLTFCPFPGKLVWCLFLDVVCLNYDGNVVDAAVLAVNAALKSCQLPKVRPKDPNESDQRGYEVTQERESLKLKGHTVSTSFALFDNELMVDPTEEEEQLSCGVITFVLTEDEKICLTHKPGGAEITDDQLRSCIRQSKARLKDVVKLLDSCSNKYS